MNDIQFFRCLVDINCQSRPTQILLYRHFVTQATMQCAKVGHSAAQGQPLGLRVRPMLKEKKAKG